MILPPDSTDSHQPRFTIRTERKAMPGDDQPIAIELEIKAPGMREGSLPRKPLNLCFVIDLSGSMTGSRLSAVKRATEQLVYDLHERDRLAIVAFNQTCRVVHPGAHLTESAREEMRAGLRTLQPRGGTNLFEGFRHGAELVVWGGSAEEYSSWVVILSDGRANQGLVDPAGLEHHASAFRERGVRAIAVGIGGNYRAAQLTALANGGGGDFHHASEPDEICEIVRGELGALRNATVHDLTVHVTVHGTQDWRLLGGHARQNGFRGQARIDRIRADGTARIIVLCWPQAGTPWAEFRVQWRDEAGRISSMVLESRPEEAPKDRDFGVATRAARLWHAHVFARALELNEEHAYHEAREFVTGEWNRMSPYLYGVAEADRLEHELAELERRVGRRWGTRAHKEAYVRAGKMLLNKEDLRSRRSTHGGRPSHTEHWPS